VPILHDTNPLISNRIACNLTLCARTDLAVCRSMLSDVISLPVATSSEHSQALAEVSHFGLTDMGFTGQGPWTYRILHDPALTRELAQMSRARTSGSVDIITLQPCPPHIYLSQDRYVVEEWDLPGGTWQFNGVFDGNYIHSL
jgi:pyruvate dehydrogenase phosphatase